MLDFMGELLNRFLQMVLTVLPHSPFQQYIKSLSGLPYLSTLNWFFPIGDMIVVGGVWLSAIALFYVYSVIMRWIKLIGE